MTTPSPETSGGSTTNSPRTFQVLAVDDSEDDMLFLCRAIKHNPHFSCVAALSSGHEALQFLRREPPFSDPAQFPDPDFLLLDLKMPDPDGFAVLDFLRQHLSQRAFKVVVLTSSSDPADLVRSKELGADYFITKSTHHLGYVELLQKLAGSK
jgi:two-component system, response regulator